MLLNFRIINKSRKGVWKNGQRNFKKGKQRYYFDCLSNHNNSAINPTGRCDCGIISREPEF